MRWAVRDVQIGIFDFLRASQLHNDERQTVLESSCKQPKGDHFSGSFLSLLATQFFGAFNDNMFRWLVVPIVKHEVSEDRAAIALSAGLSCFVLPYLVLAAPAGYLADRFCKRTVIIGCKVAEVAVMLLGVAAIWYGNILLLFVVVGLMGSQSALFGPSKFGAIPEILRPEKISVGNGLVGLSTIMAVVGGTVAGNYLYDWTGPDGRSHLWMSALALTGLATIGWLTSLGVRSGPAADPLRRFPYNLVARTVSDLQSLGHSLPLLRVALGIGFFWSLASLAQLNVDYFGIVELGLEQKYVGFLLGILSLGVGAGSILAGWWSAGRVEVGLVPLGALGIAISSMLLFTVPEPSQANTAAYAWSCVWLCCLGLSSGLFDVPLQAFMQHRSPTSLRGSILAAANFLTFSGMLLTALLFWMLRDLVSLSARQIFLLAGLLTLGVAVYAFFLLPQATLRCVMWLVSHTAYRTRVYGRENLPSEEGALLVANHVTWVDGVFLLIVSSRPIRLVVDADYIQGWWIRGLARFVGTIPIQRGPKSVNKAIHTAREALKNGELVCVFPEGMMTRTGQLQGFKRGVMQILNGTGAPMIPVYLDGLWGSIFSSRIGTMPWKWPYPVSIWFGSRIVHPEDVREVQQAVQDLGAEAVKSRKKRSMNLPRAFLRKCRAAMFRAKVSDSTGAKLTGGGLLMRTLVLRRILMREILGKEEKFVGILIPPSVGGMVTNAAVTLTGRVAVNLNYTASSEVMSACLKRANIGHVLTTRRVTKTIDFSVDTDFVYLDDFKQRITWFDKLVAFWQTYLTPVWVLDVLLGLRSIQGDDVMTVIFTSGSTGKPKGVMLTYRNVASNVEAIDQVVQLKSDDVLVGILPFFHSFGLTITVWAVLGLNVRGTYHYTPLDAKEVGKLCRQNRGTVLLATPTFLRSYVKRCSAEDFASLEVVVVGAEKLPILLSGQFEARFGVRPVEGYGATELSPLVSVNVPPSRSRNAMVDCKEGTVGRPVPGVSAKIVDRETHEDLRMGQPGMLLIKGPNVMKGYLGQPDKTAEVLYDGWYVTGDIAKIDKDGFIHITGRLSRFSKIGGEMVPHVRVEEALQAMWAADEGELKAVVTAVPDERKGERLMVIYTELPETPDVVCKKLSAAGLPNLWIPSPNSFKKVDVLPLLGTGKLDLQLAKQMALTAIESG